VVSDIAMDAMPARDLLGTVTMTSIYGRFDAYATSTSRICPDVWVSNVLMRADWVYATTDLTLIVASGTTTATAQNTRINIVNLAFDIPGFPNELEARLAPLLETQIESAMAPMLESSIPPLIEDVFRNLSYGDTFSLIGYPFSFTAIAAEDAMDSSGARFFIDTQIFSPTDSSCFNAQGFEYEAPAQTVFPTGLPSTGSSYHAAVAITDDSVNQFLFETVDLPEFCIHLSDTDTPALNTKTFQYLLPELYAMAPDAPMMLDIRPQNNPRVLCTCQPDLTMLLDDTVMDIWVWLEDRYVRLMTLWVDISVAASAKLSYNNIIDITLGEANVTADVKFKKLVDIPNAVVEKFFPYLLESYLPQLESALDQIVLPSLQGFSFHLIETGCASDSGALIFYTNLSYAN
jgi:hypothetical protein